MSDESTWATVTAVAPLRIKLDGDITALPFAPDSLIDPLLLSVADRVRCGIVGRKVLIIGRSGGTPVASNAQAIAGLDGSRAITPASLKAAFEAARPLQGIKPSSVSVGSGSASVSDDGTVSFTGASSVSMHDLFDGQGADLYQFFGSFQSSADLQNINARFRTAAGVDLAAANSYGAQYAGVVSSASSLGGTSGATLTSMYLGYGRTQPGQTAYGLIARPRGGGVKTLHTNTHGYNYVVYNMGNFTGSPVAYPSLTIFPGSGTITGTFKVVKL